MGSVHFTSPSQTPDLNPQNFLNYLNVERSASPHTIAAYQRDLQHYVACPQILECNTLAQVTEVDLEDSVRALGGGFASFPSLGLTSVWRCLTTTRSWHRYLFDSGSLDADVASNVKPARLSRHLPETLNLEEMETLLVAMSPSGGDSSLCNRASLELPYTSSACISETVNLVLDDTGFETELVLVRLFGKGRKEGISMFSRQTYRALQAYLIRMRPTLAGEDQPAGRMFLDVHGKSMSRQTAWVTIRAAARYAQIDRPVRPHTLRHCFVMRLLQGGADIRVVQELLGHASVTTTEIYMKVSRQMLLEVYASVHPRA